LRAKHPRLASLTFIDKDIPDKELLELYRRADALVLPTRGEGFNMPAAEGFAAEIPVITTRGSGHLDFCDDTNSWLVDYRFEPSRSHVASAGSVWMEPDHADLVRTMRQLFECSRTSAAGLRVRARTERAARVVGERLSTEHWFAGVDTIADRLLQSPPPPRKPRVAWVSTWRTQCGIAEYLALPPRAVRPGRVRDRSFGDQRTPDDDSNPAAIRFATASWEHSAEGWQRNLINLISFDPHVIIVHTSGDCSGPADLAAMVTDPRLASAAVIITLHNTREIETFSPREPRRHLASGCAARRASWSIAWTI